MIDQQKFMNWVFGVGVVSSVFVTPFSTIFYVFSDYDQDSILVFILMMGTLALFSLGWVFFWALKHRISSYMVISGFIILAVIAFFLMTFDVINPVELFS